MKIFVFIVAAGLLASVGAWPKADNYYGGKLQNYLNKIAEIKKGNTVPYYIIMWLYINIMSTWLIHSIFCMLTLLAEMNSEVIIEENGEQNQVVDTQCHKLNYGAYYHRCG